MNFVKRISAILTETLNLNGHIDTDAAERSIRSNIEFKGPNAWILAVAVIIASVGLNVNSIPVVIGAMLISPLAKKLCLKQGIDPATLRGSGPRGRIMAADVTTPAPRGKGETTMADNCLGITRPEKDGFHIFDDEADMSALAAISMPIAVQCEKLLENRYSLFDYIVRAVVRACTGQPEWMDADGQVNVLLFEHSGQKVAAIADAARKTVYKLSREIAKAPAMPEGFLTKSFFHWAGFTDQT